MIGTWPGSNETQFSLWYPSVLCHDGYFWLWFFLSIHAVFRQGVAKKTGWKQWCRSSGSSSETYWRPHRQKEPRHLSCSISICRSSSIQCVFDFFQSLVYHSVSFPLQVCTWRRRGLHCRLGGVYRPAKRNNGSSNGQIWWQLLRPGWMLRGDKAVVLSALSGQSTLAAWVTADIGCEILANTRTSKPKVQARCSGISPLTTKSRRCGTELGGCHLQDQPQMRRRCAECMEDLPTNHLNSW